LDLVDHPTVQYISELEAAVQRYKDMYKGELEKHRLLRVAFEAHKRQVKAT
jgi:hypothetical protein